MLAFKVNFWDDTRLCTPTCGHSAVAILNNACEGLCDAVEDLYYFDADPECHKPPVSPLPYLDSFPENEVFESMRV
jgi:hypothetical protein